MTKRTEKPRRGRGRPQSFPFDSHGLDATPLQIAKRLLRVDSGKRSKRGK